MSTQDDQARAIAERVARRLAGNTTQWFAGNRDSQNEPISASDSPRARMIDFISPGPPVRSVPSASHLSFETKDPEQVRPAPQTEFFQFVPVAQSPWLGRLPSMLAGGTPQSAIASSQPVDHPSEERFGVDEAAVTELVEFFENEKKCSVDPSGKPCDHCAMCSSRGF